MNKLFVCAVLFCASIAPTAAQVATGGTYTIEQSVIASGGGTNSTGGVYMLDGAIGEPIAGIVSNASPFRVTGGFFAPRSFSPTAAAISISGRVVTPDGSGLRNAMVILTAPNGSQTTIFSGIRGAYSFTNLTAGEIYVISIFSKRYQFAPQVVTANENVENFMMTAIQSNGGGLLPL